MTLEQAISDFPLTGLDSQVLMDQEGAFQMCLRFLSTVDKTKQVNDRAQSGRLKHCVEDPSNFGLGIPSRYHGYVYEGTFILAALASGFTRFAEKGRLRSRFNMSERSLRRRAKEWAAED